MKSNNRIAITLGDIGGIGSEVVLKSLCDENIYNLAQYLVIGSYKALLCWVKLLNINNNIKINKINSLKDIKKSPYIINILDVGVGIDEVTPGAIKPEYGVCAFESIKEATKLALNKDVCGIVTAPISKKALYDAGYKFAGHTEILKELTSAQEVAMMFHCNLFKVTLATIHIPLGDVSRYITVENILSKLRLTIEFLRTKEELDFPRIAVCSLNPHAGEEGILGSEEKENITPAIEYANNLWSGQACIEGPFPADTLFSKVINKQEKYSAILAMYHDQGLIPIKLYKSSAVNITLGLPIIRTSPAHGTAYDIAGKNIASAESFKSAIKYTSWLIKKTVKLE